MISEDDSAFRIVFNWVDPWICREVKRSIIESMKHNLYQIDFSTVVISNQDSSRISKIGRNCKICSVLNNVGLSWWTTWRPTGHIGLYTPPRIEICNSHMNYDKLYPKISSLSKYYKQSWPERKMISNQLNQKLKLMVKPQICYALLKCPWHETLWAKSMDAAALNIPL